MSGILDDIKARMYALDRALPDNSAARDLQEILHRSQVEIGKLREALGLLLGHFDEFTSERRGGWGNQEDAYYCLAKGTQDSWKKAREALL